jgi:hypothetical protein
MIATYFPGLADCWFLYSDAITAFLEANGDAADAKAGEISAQLDETRDSCSWDQELPPKETARLKTLESRLGLPDLTGTRVRVNGSELGELLLIGRDGIIRRIVSADARGYAHGLF